MSEKQQYSYLRIEHYSGHPEVKKAAETLLSAVASTKKSGRLNNRQSWVGAARKLVASLWLREEDMFRFGTKKDYFAGKNRKQVWTTPKTLELFKAAEKLSWVKKIMEGVPPAYSTKPSGGLVTVYCRQLAFKKLMHSLRIEDVEVDEELPWVTLRDTSDCIQELPAAYTQTDSYQQTVTTLKNHYRLLRSSNVVDEEGNPLAAITYRYTRRWKKDMGTGGRFYSPFCNMPKEYRLGITVSGEPVGSWDFSQLHPTLLLLLTNGTGKESNLFSTGDVYDMPDYPELPRSAHKKFINTILNAESRNAAVKSIGTAHYYWDLYDECWVYETYSGKQTRSGAPVWPDKPQTAADAYVSAFLFRHPNFQDLAFKGMWGTLQLIDSSIIEEAVRQATALGIPVLPVHDELVVPVSKKAVVQRILSQSFQAVTLGKYKDFEPPMSWSDARTLGGRTA